MTTLPSYFDVWVCKRKSELFFFPISKNGNADIVIEIPPDMLSTDSSVESIGHAVVASAERVRNGTLANPIALDKMAESIGEKSWSALVRKVGYCEIERKAESSTIAIMPGKREKDGFVCYEGATVSLNNPTAIGEAILKYVAMYEPKK